MFQSRMPVVFVHGIKGATLVDQEDRLRWLSIKSVCGIERKSLALPLQWQDGVQVKDDLLANGVLRKVAFKTIYGRFLRWMENSEFDFYPFHYDWRRSLYESVVKLNRFLEPIVAEKGPVLLIAHSMGGLISFRLLADEPGLFRGALFAGVPFGSGVAFYDDMHNGVSVGFNTVITDAAAHFSWASPYVFFPLSSEDNRMIDRRGKDVSFNWYDPSDWLTKCMSRYSNEKANQEVAFTHLSHALKQARDYRENLVPSELLLKEALPIAVLASKRHSTISRLVYDAENRQPWRFKTSVRELGDGRVVFAAARPSSTLEYRYFMTDYQHGRLLDDEEVLSRSLAWLIELS